MSGLEAIAVAFMLALPLTILFIWITNKLWGEPRTPIEHHSPSKWDKLL